MNTFLAFFFCIPAISLVVALALDLRTLNPRKAVK